jgi:hypothetical protein
MPVQRPLTNMHKGGGQLLLQQATAAGYTYSAAFVCHALPTHG